MSHLSGAQHAAKRNGVLLTRDRSKLGAGTIPALRSTASGKSTKAATDLN
jgi:hypothetical protein